MPWGSQLQGRGTGSQGSYLGQAFGMGEPWRAPGSLQMELWRKRVGHLGPPGAGADTRLPSSRRAQAGLGTQFSAFLT